MLELAAASGIDTLATAIGYVAGALTTLAFLPQVLKAWRSRSVEDLSLAMLVIFALGVVLMRSARLSSSNRALRRSRIF